jgi:PKD repeat protein
MSVPQIYLVEPYNPYAPKGGRKKHWTEIVEEQALLERIIAEANSRTLPPNSPAVSTPTVGNAAGGAGGSPIPAYFHPTLTAAFTVSPTTGSAPSQFVFTNASSQDALAEGVSTFLWNFGDGSTSTLVSPSHTYTTTGSNFQVTLLVTSVSSGATASVSGSVNVTAPTVTADFSETPSLGIAPLSASFTNLTSTNNSQNTINYLWVFGDGTTSVETNPVHVYQTGSFTVRLQATGSFGIASVKTLSGGVTASAPTVTAAFTYTTSSNSAPSIATFVNTSTYNSSGSLNYLWTFGSASLTSTASNPAPFTYTHSGAYTASLQVTESLYGIASKATVMFSLS